VTVLIDSFGNKVLVQTAILNAEHATAVEAEKVAMQAREDQFIAVLKEKHNHTDAMIEALKKQPGDCGCR